MVIKALAATEAWEHNLLRDCLNSVGLGARTPDPIRLSSSKAGIALGSPEGLSDTRCRYLLEILGVWEQVHFGVGVIRTGPSFWVRMERKNYVRVTPPGLPRLKPGVQLLAKLGPPATESIRSGAIQLLIVLSVSAVSAEPSQLCLEQQESLNPGHGVLNRGMDRSDVSQRSHSDTGVRAAGNEQSDRDS